MSDDAHKWLGRCWQAKGDLEGAVQCFQKAIQIRPGYWENHNRLGICYYYFGRYHDAAEQFRRVITIQPDNYLGYDTLGGIYNLLGSYEDAVAMHKRAIEIYPNPSSYANLGTDYFFLGQYGEAIAAYESAVELDPRGDVLRRNLGDAYLRVGRAKDAIEQYRRASDLLREHLNINHDDAEVLGRLAICQAKLDRDQDALSTIERAITLEPRNTTLMYQQAVVYALAGELEKAIKHLATALSHGYSCSSAECDPDLEVLRGQPEYHSLLARLNKPLSD
jgi:tetratricopeptide (TPR) repeat protein